MRFLIGFLSGIAAIVALAQSTAARRSRVVVRSTLPVDRPAVSRNLARYYRVSLN